MDDFAAAATLVAKAQRIAVLTGAGVSAESGIPTFRGLGGLWNGRDPMSLATPQAFDDDPALVWEFYN
ncbi:Sir2 family NAD-dependent protein deacetylase, partial [Singulisphaera rosea]